MPADAPRPQRVRPGVGRTRRAAAGRARDPRASRCQALLAGQAVWEARVAARAAARAHAFGADAAAAARSHLRPRLERGLRVRAGDRRRRPRLGPHPHRHPVGPPRPRLAPPPTSGPRGRDDPRPRHARPGRRSRSSAFLPLVAADRAGRVHGDLRARRRRAGGRGRRGGGARPPPGRRRPARGGEDALPRGRARAARRSPSAAAASASACAPGSPLPVPGLADRLAGDVRAYAGPS